MEWSRRAVWLAGAVAVFVGAGVAVAPVPADAGRVLLRIDDGKSFYTRDVKRCLGDAPGPETGTPRRDWTLGKPALPYLIPQAEEPESIGGSGCLGGPRLFGPIRVKGLARVSGSILYSTVAGGCCSDVHLHVREPVFGGLVTSTLLMRGPAPAPPTMLLEHRFDFTLAAGSYLFQEDVVSGTRAMWLTSLRIVDSM